MVRSYETELLDSEQLPPPIVERAYRDLTRLHRVLGNTARIVDAIRRDPLPVRRVLDIGCGHGGVSALVRDRLGIDVVGVDLKPPRNAPVPILQADAVRDRLPKADIAYSLCLAHHLADEELAALIQNVGRSCRRFILIDLVRHWLPLALFRVFVAPFFSRVAIADGATSIRRAFTPAELRAIVASTGARFRHAVAPFRATQTIDISF